MNAPKPSATSKYLSIKKLLYLVQATDHTKQRAWYYIRVQPDKCQHLNASL